MPDKWQKKIMKVLKDISTDLYTFLSNA